MYPFVVADIGGTNARFALVTGKETAVADDNFEQFVPSFNIEEVKILKGAEFPSFEDAMSAYLGSIRSEKIKAACVAIAGPIGGDKVAMTNLPWAFSQEDLRKRFDLKVFEAINDYTALALATSQIESSGLASVVAGVRKNKANKAIFGPGSGLGVAGLAYSDKGWLPISSEGGHVNMAPSNELEIEVLRYLMQKHGHVSAEMCLSGPGLENLYEALCHIRDVAKQDIHASDISNAALGQRNSECFDALSLFCALLGSLAGNLVLTYGAKGGAYITGGIVPRFVDFLRDSEFEQRFRNKGVMSKYLKDVPVDVVVYDQPAFLGAATWMEQTLN